MKNSKVFHNTWALQQLPITLKLASFDWKFLLCSDGKTSVEQIQQRLGISDKERDSIVARLLESGLLTESNLSLEEYARTVVDTASNQPEPQTLTDFLRSSESTEKPQPQGDDLPAFRPLPNPSEAVAHRSMSLKAVIQFILNQSADPIAGQLATYQVFMGINTQLLKRNGITSLRFQDDRTITDPELQTAIEENIAKVLRVTCPWSVYSEAGR